MSDVRITIDAQIQVRRDTEANWISVDPVLRDGEVAYSKDIKNLKIGDGASHWSELDYLATGGEGGGIDEQELERYLQDNGYLKDANLSDYAKTADVTTSMKEINGSIKNLADLLSSMWHLDENGNLVTEHQVIIKNSLISEDDTSSGGEGQDTPASGIRGIYVNGTPYTDTDGDGFIDLGTISGGGGTADLSNYYTKSESDARYLPLSGGMINGAAALDVHRNDGAYGSLIKFSNTSGELGYIGFTHNKIATIWSDINADGYTLIHSGNIGSYALPISGGNLTGRLVAQAGISSWQGADLFSSERLALNLNSNNAYGVYASFQQSDVTKFMWGYSPILGAAWFENANSLGFYLSDNGNFGIGTSNPQYKLDVNGNSRINGNLIVNGDVASA